jgi:hypothetical protein
MRDMGTLFRSSAAPRRSPYGDEPPIQRHRPQATPVGARPIPRPEGNVDHSIWAGREILPDVDRPHFLPPMVDDEADDSDAP